MKSFKKFLTENEEQMMLFPTDRAAAEIHAAWMARNQPSPLHVPFDELPENEKEKDRQHLETIAGLISQTKIPTDQLNASSTREAYRNMIASAFGSIQHEKWRDTLPDDQKFNPDGTPKERMRDRGGVMVDVNLPWEQLHPNAQADNLMAGLAAYDAYTKHISDPLAQLPSSREEALQDQWDDIANTYRRGRKR